MSTLKVVKKNKTNLTFGLLKVGTVFTYDCDHYLKIEEINGMTMFNAVDLESFEAVKFSYNTTVEVEEATLTIG